MFSTCGKKKQCISLIRRYVFHICTENIYGKHTMCLEAAVVKGIYYFLIFALKHRVWVLVRTDLDCGNPLEQLQSML